MTTSRNSGHRSSPGACTEVSRQDLHDRLKGLSGQQLVNISLESHLAVVAGYDSVLRCFTDGTALPVSTGIPVARPENSSNARPESWKVSLTSSNVLCSWAESTHQNALLCSNALL